MGNEPKESKTSSGNSSQCKSTQLFVFLCVVFLFHWDSNVEKNQPADVNWEELGFSLTPTDYMYEMKCGPGECCFSEGTLLPFGNIEMSPCSAILNYGQVRKGYGIEMPRSRCPKM